VDSEWKERIERELATLREEVSGLRRLLKHEPGDRPSPGEASPESQGTFVP
jgi:hypothetical protein